MTKYCKSCDKQISLSNWSKHMHALHPGMDINGNGECNGNGGFDADIAPVLSNMARFYKFIKWAAFFTITLQFGWKAWTVVHDWTGVEVKPDQFLIDRYHRT